MKSSTFSPADVAAIAIASVAVFTILVNEIRSIYLPQQVSIWRTVASFVWARTNSLPVKVQVIWWGYESRDKGNAAMLIYVRFTVRSPYDVSIVFPRAINSNSDIFGNLYTNPYVDAGASFKSHIARIQGSIPTPSGVPADLRLSVNADGRNCLSAPVQTTRVTEGTLEDGLVKFLAGKLASK